MRASMAHLLLLPLLPLLHLVSGAPPPPRGIEVTKFHVSSSVQLRYSLTRVEARMTNPTSSTQQASFHLTIPDNAFISNFSLEVAGVEHVARVEERARAEALFEVAAEGEEWGGLVEQDSNDPNRFRVTTSVEGGQKVVFRLAYDELLQRVAAMYHQEIHIDLAAAVEDFRIEVAITESLPITEVRVPRLLQAHEILPKHEPENSLAKIETNVDGKTNQARVVFAPSREEQEEEGVQGRLVVRYEVDRQGQANELQVALLLLLLLLHQVIDGYFIHYFVPEHLPALPKHTVFVLDVSASMVGEKLRQLKDAMFTVLDDMTDQDYFNIVTFGTAVYHWEDSMSVVRATAASKARAIAFILDLEERGGTNINEAVLAGLWVAEQASSSLPSGVASILVFLSDGRPTQGDTNSTRIRSNIVTLNSRLGLPIFSVAFGVGADFQLLRKISSSSSSFARRIYEGSDAALQLENFYAEISRPVVTRLKFAYQGDMVDNSSLTSTELSTLFEGGQFVVVGRVREGWSGGEVQVRVVGEQREEMYEDELDICFTEDERGVVPGACGLVQRSGAQRFLQRLHAFLNVQQLLRQGREEEALPLALASNFVTSLTSLVVVRPNQEALADFGQLPDYNEQADYYVADYGGGDYDEEEEGENKEEEKEGDKEEEELEVETQPTNQTCALSLYQKTYFRGRQSVLRTERRSEFPELPRGTDDLAVSARVHGPCCWQVFGERGFGGLSTLLVPGASYHGTSSFGRGLFRDISSARVVPCP